MFESGDKIDRIEEMKRRLYSKSDRLLKRKSQPFQQVKYGSKTEWEPFQTMPYKRKTKLNPSLFKKLFIFSVVFFIGALLFAGYMFWGGNNTISEQNIDIAVIGNSFSAGGEELPLQIEITNKNSVALEYSDLLIEYPKGGGDTTDAVRLPVIPIGTISGGGIAKENVKLTLFGEQGSTKDIKISLQYRVQGSNAIFVKAKDYIVNISSAPVMLTFDAPDSSSSNQEITLNIKATLNTQKPVQNLRLEASYPTGFRFTSATPVPSFGDHTWNLGDLSTGTEKDIIVKGVILGQEGEERTFHVYSGEPDSADQTRVGVVYNSISHSIRIERPFVEAKLAVNGSTENEIAASGKQSFSGTITWINNLPTRVDDVEISVAFAGNAFDVNKIDAGQGFFDSVNKKIVWNKSTNDELASLEPGDTGSTSFNFGALPLLTSSQSFIQNPQVELQVSLKGKQATENNTYQEINNTEKKIVKINSDLQLTSQLLHFTGPLTNTGPIPLKVGTETTYTIIWSVNNSANPVTGAEVHSSLAPFSVTWLGKISPADTDISYNEATKEIVWKVGNVETGAGISSAGKQVAFQVGVTPSLSQVGSTPALLGSSTLTGTDTFTNSLLKSVKNPLQARLTNDSGWTGNSEGVVE